MTEEWESRGGQCDLLRVDQVGSLLRPGELKAAFEHHERGELDGAALHEQVRSSVAEVIAQQSARGVLPVTDGEFWRRNFQDTFAQSVTGYATPATQSSDANDDTASGQVSEAVYVVRHPVTERLELARNVLLEEYLVAREFTELPIKVTLTGPERHTQRFDLEHSSDVYQDFDSFMDDVVGIERRIIGAVIEAGCPYVHIDEPAYTAYVDPTSLEWMRTRHWDPASRLTRAIAADNALIAGFPDTTFGLHICRGNAAGHWHREGSYDGIAEELYSTLRFPRLLLEYDTERAGGFEGLRFVPKGVVAVLGLVTTKSGEPEDRDMLLRRIEEASKYLPIEQLAISPQCGFASDMGGNPLTEDEQWRKLELVQQVAEVVWGRYETPPLS